MKIITNQTHKAAEKRGYSLQLSQHAPSGLRGAFSLQCFITQEGKLHRDYYIGCTAQEARKNVQLIVAQL